MTIKITDVENFYDGKVIFVTGCTGFLGKSLLEKILYSCNGTSKIYVLVREKRGKSAQERINQLFNTPAFDRLKSRSGFQSKTVGLAGDVSKTNLGLSDDQLKCLQNEVSIVFHLAATVNFNETLQEALNVNVNGTREMLKLCSQMDKLQAFIHVSTAFSHSDRKIIDEVIYPPPRNFEEALRIAASNPDEETIKKVLGNKPNSYTYSKALAEDLVARYSNIIPAAIVRPSIVMASLSEPRPGWVDNWNGSTGLFVGVSSGIQKVAIGRGSNITDLVPVDIVTNLTIVAATQCEKSNYVKVYNCCTGSSNPITCDEAKWAARRATLKYSLNVFPWPYLIFTSNHVVYYILRFFLQMIPAYIADLYITYNGKEAQQVKMQVKLNRMVHAVKFFLLYEWNFIDKNVRNLWHSLSEQDKRMFNFDVKSITWERCIEDYVIGARKYLLKEKY